MFIQCRCLRSIKTPNCVFTTEKLRYTEIMTNFLGQNVNSSRKIVYEKKFRGECISDKHYCTFYFAVHQVQYLENVCSTSFTKSLLPHELQTRTHLNFDSIIGLQPMAAPLAAVKVLDERKGGSSIQCTRRDWLWGYGMSETRRVASTNSLSRSRQITRIHIDSNFYLKQLWWWFLDLSKQTLVPWRKWLALSELKL